MSSAEPEMKEGIFSNNNNSKKTQEFAELFLLKHYLFVFHSFSGFPSFFQCSFFIKLEFGKQSTQGR